MNTDTNPHVKLLLSPRSADPSEIVDADMRVNHSNRGGRRYTLKAVITGIDLEEVIYSKTQDFSAGLPHQRIANFPAPITPGYYKVTAYLLSEDGKELASSEDSLLVNVSP
jgi:hypothetical protein